MTHQRALTRADVRGESSISCNPFLDATRITKKPPAQQQTYKRTCTHSQRQTFHSVHIIITDVAHLHILQRTHARTYVYIQAHVHVHGEYGAKRKCIAAHKTPHVHCTTTIHLAGNLNGGRRASSPPRRAVAVDGISHFCEYELVANAKPSTCILHVICTQRSANIYIYTSTFIYYMCTYMCMCIVHNRAQ